MKIFEGILYIEIVVICNFSTGYNCFWINLVINGPKIKTPGDLIFFEY